MFHCGGHCTYAFVSWLSHTGTDTTCFSATVYFSSHALEVKNHWKESWPKPSTELVTRAGHKTDMLTGVHTMPTHNDPAERGLLKIFWEKEKMLVTSIFSFSHNVFYPKKDRNYHSGYVYNVICTYFQIGRV